MGGITLPANTDLTSYLLDHLTSADGLIQGIEGAVSGLVDGLESQFSACATALGSLDPTHLLGTRPATHRRTRLGPQPVRGRRQCTRRQPVRPRGTGTPLAALGNVLDIAVNVQHGGSGAGVVPLAGAGRLRPADCREHRGAHCRPGRAAGHPTSRAALPLTIVVLGLFAGSAAIYGLRRRLTRPRRRRDGCALEHRKVSEVGCRLPP